MRASEWFEPTPKDWTTRFTAALTRMFIARGVAPRDAAEDANAHAGERYPNRHGGTPEDEAALVFNTLPFVDAAPEEWAED